MNDNVMTGKSLGLLRTLCAVNFNAAVVFLFVVSVMSAMGSTFFFEDESELYGPMMGNLRLMLFYLCLTEVAVYSYCRYKDDYKAILVLGLFLLVLIVSVEFYGLINDVPVDDNYGWFFLYLGLSHLLYGGFIQFQKEFKP